MKTHLINVLRSHGIEPNADVIDSLVRTFEIYGDEHLKSECTAALVALKECYGQISTDESFPVDIKNQVRQRLDAAGFPYSPRN